MNVRATGFLALLAVIGLSIAFGMVIGGKLNAPEMVLAAPDVKPLKLAPASTGGPAGSPLLAGAPAGTSCGPPAAHERADYA